MVLVTLTLVVPDRIDTQSSPACTKYLRSRPDRVQYILVPSEGRRVVVDPYIPVCIEQDEMFTWLEEPILIPSVLGLSPGAVMETLCTCTCVHSYRIMFFSAPSLRRMLVTRRLLQCANDSDCEREEVLCVCKCTLTYPWPVIAFLSTRERYQIRLLQIYGDKYIY